MLTNPYSNTPNPLRLQTDVPFEVKGLLQSHLPLRNFNQLIVGNLIHNLHNDLIQLGLTTPTANSTTIMSILCEPRPLSTEQCDRLSALCGVPITSLTSQIPPGLQHTGGGSKLHPTTTDAPTKRTRNAKRTADGK